MDKKFVVVTGSSGGIGAITAKELLKAGYSVIGIDLAKSVIEDSNYHHFVCDLTKDYSIENAKNEIIKITDNIYTILNCAGIFMLQTIIEGSEDDLRKILEINFFGAYKLNRALFPLLSKGSKIIIFSSEVARYSIQPFNGYYALSKVLVDKYADVLRREMNYLGIKVVKVQSGAIKTNLLNGVNKKYEDTVNNTKYYKKPLTKLKSLMDDEINKQVDPKVVAIKLVKIIQKKRNKLLYKIKNSFKLRFLNKLPEKLQDKIYVKVIK